MSYCGIWCVGSFFDRICSPADNSVTLSLIHEDLIRVGLFPAISTVLRDKLTIGLYKA